MFAKYEKALAVTPEFIQAAVIDREGLISRIRTKYAVNEKNYHMKYVMLSLPKHLMWPYDRQKIPRQARDATRDGKKFRLHHTSPVSFEVAPRFGMCHSLFLKKIPC